MSKFNKELVFTNLQRHIDLVKSAMYERGWFANDMSTLEMYVTSGESIVYNSCSDWQNPEYPYRSGSKYYALFMPDLKAVSYLRKDFSNERLKDRFRPYHIYEILEYIWGDRLLDYCFVPIKDTEMKYIPIDIVVAGGDGKSYVVLKPMTKGENKIIVTTEQLLHDYQSVAGKVIGVRLQK